MMKYNLKNKLPGQTGFNMRIFILIFSVILIVCYGIFNARNLIIGPSIEIFTPIGFETEATENTITIKGRVKNMTYLSLNKRPIFADTQGYFEEKLLLSPGFNIIEFKIKDRFKQEAEKEIRVYYKQSTSTPEIITGETG